MVSFISYQGCKMSGIYRKSCISIGRNSIPDFRVFYPLRSADNYGLRRIRKRGTRVNHRLVSGIFTYFRRKSLVLFIFVLMELRKFEYNCETSSFCFPAIGPHDVLATLLNNLKVQERQNRVCTTVAIAIVAETCSPFTVLPGNVPFGANNSAKRPSDSDKIPNADSSHCPFVMPGRQTVKHP